MKEVTFTVATNPQTFLDTRLLLANYIITNEINRRANKFPVHWKLKIPKEME